MNQFPLGPLSIPFQKVKKIRGGIQNCVYIASVVDMLAVQKHHMSVNSNPSASQQDMKKTSKMFSFNAGVVHTGDKPLLLNIQYS
jgi:hypothetical protein